MKRNKTKHSTRPEEFIDLPRHNFIQKMEKAIATIDAMMPLVKQGYEIKNRKRSWFSRLFSFGTPQPIKRCIRTRKYFENCLKKASDETYTILKVSTALIDAADSWIETEQELAILHSGLSYREPIKIT